MSSINSILSKQIDTYTIWKSEFSIGRRYSQELSPQTKKHHGYIWWLNYYTHLGLIKYQLESRWRNSHVLVYHGPVLSHLRGVASHLLSYIIPCSTSLSQYQHLDWVKKMTCKDKIRHFLSPRKTWDSKSPQSNWTGTNKSATVLPDTYIFPAVPATV